MNTSLVIAAFKELASSKSLDPDEVNAIIREGFHAGLARIYGAEVDAEIIVDDLAGDIQMTVLRRVVDDVEVPAAEISMEEARWDDPTYEVGDVMEIPVDFSQFGRNAVMAAKQKILQLVRDREQQRIRDEYVDRVGEMLSGEVQQIERGKLVLILNRTREAEAIIPWKDQNPRERFRQGESIRAVLKEVDETPKGPRLIFSRADKLFVAALFRLEVPEIYQGIVEIKELTREVGGRTKIAVHSRDESIDPVGACVGLKGSRVQAVVSELGGERIDIVPWHPDPEVFARRSLAPARVAKVISDSERRVITAIVDEDQLSLAIGRNGQNVRLASQLIGWQIDLYGSREWLERGGASILVEAERDGYETADFPLSELDLEEGTLSALSSAGYQSFVDIIDLELADFLAVDGVTEEAAGRLLGVIDELTVLDSDGDAEARADAGPGADSEAGGEAVEDEAVEDEAVQDEAAQNEAVVDEAAQDEAVEDEAVEDEAAQNEAVVDEAAQNEAVVDEAGEVRLETVGHAATAGASDAAGGAGD